jgi:acid stress chaperone HdeB
MCLRTVIALALLLTPLSWAQAQVVIDVTQITCDQFVHAKVGPTRPVGLWLSGFYHGLGNSRTFDLRAFESRLSKVKSFCYDENNNAVPIMQVFERIYRQVK